MIIVTVVVVVACCVVVILCACYFRARSQVKVSLDTCSAKTHGSCINYHCQQDLSDYQVISRYLC